MFFNINKSISLDQRTFFSINKTFFNSKKNFFERISKKCFIDSKKLFSQCKALGTIRIGLFTMSMIRVIICIAFGLIKSLNSPKNQVINIILSKAIRLINYIFIIYEQ